MSAKRSLKCWLLCLFLLFFAKAGWCNKDLGKALVEAMQIRATGTVEEVISHFQNVSDQTINPRQKASVLFLLAEFLMQKQEWAKAAEIYETILATDYSSDMGGAFYGLAQTYMMRNQPSKAKEVCDRLTANCSESSMIGFAYDMKEIDPNGVHAKLSAFLNSTLIWPPQTAISESPGLEAPPVQPLNVISKPVTVNDRQPAIKENRLTIGVIGWNSDLEGKIEAKGMSLGLADDTDIDAQTSLALSAHWKLSEKDQLSIDYSQFDHKGSLNKTVNFDTLDYTAGASINEQTSFTDVGLSRLLTKSEQDSWKLLYGLKFSHIFMSLAQPTPKGAQTGEIKQNFTIPYLGIEGNTKLSDNISLNGSIKYLSLSQSGSNDRLTDFYVGLLFGRDYAKRPTETEWYGTLGYRFFLFQGKAYNDSSEVSYSGPTFGLESRF